MPTVQAAYAFVATHTATLLRLTWLPILISASAGTWATLKLLPYRAALQSANPPEVAAALQSVLGWVMLGLLVPVIMSAVAAVAILRYVIRGEAGSATRLMSRLVSRNCASSPSRS
jgi:hypothetical protein